MSYQGDIAEDQAFSFHFTTRKDTGLPTTLSGVPVLSVYKDNNLTQTTTGPTLTVDADGVTGYNRVDMVTTDAFYVAGSDYTIVISTGTVNSISVVGEVVGTFSVDNRGLLRLNATAETNLEDQYDGTGITGDNFPSTQSQLSGLANVGSAVNRPAASYTLTTGTQSANTYTATEALDGTKHEHTDAAGVMELYYEFNIGSGTPSSVQVSGYVTGPNDDLDVYGYDWVATAWVQIGNIQGSSSTTNAVNSFDMFVDMVGSGANSGVVRVRLYKASGLTSALLAIDQIFVAFNQGVSGYENGAVWFDSDASNTNTVVGVDGTSTNPVSTEAAVDTLLAATNLKRVEVALESSVTFAISHTNEIWNGEHWAAALGGQDLSGSHLQGADISGIATGTTRIDFLRCTINTATIHQFHMVDCGFDGTLTFGEAGDYVISNGHSAIAGATTPIIDTGAALANVNLAMPGWFNGVEIRNLNNTGTDLFSISGIGQIIYAASCSGTVNQRGDWRVTNTGGVTITEDDNTANVAAILVDTGTTIPGTLGTPVGADMSTDIAAVKVDTAATLVDTNELQGDWTDGGRLDLLLDALITEIDTATGEPGQEAPGVSIKRGKKIDYIYKTLRNKSTQTATQQNIYADDGTTVDHKATISDDGTTYTKGEFTTGA